MHRRVRRRVPVIVAHPGVGIAVGIEESADLVLIEGYPLLGTLLSAVAAEAGAEDVSATARAELSPAAQTFGDGKPRFHARAFFSRELTRRSLSSRLALPQRAETCALQGLPGQHCFLRTQGVPQQGRQCEWTASMAPRLLNNAPGCNRVAVRPAAPDRPLESPCNREAPLPGFEPGFPD
jgi:hypothetical protein